MKPGRNHPEIFAIVSALLAGPIPAEATERMWLPGTGAVRLPDIRPWGRSDRRLPAPPAVGGTLH